MVPVRGAVRGALRLLGITPGEEREEQSVGSAAEEPAAVAPHGPSDSPDSSDAPPGESTVEHPTEAGADSTDEAPDQTPDDAAALHAD